MKKEQRKKPESTGVGCSFIQQVMVVLKDKLKVMFKTEN